jgi:hypothetical protein
MNLHTKKHLDKCLLEKGWNTLYLEMEGVDLKLVILLNWEHPFYTRIVDALARRRFKEVPNCLYGIEKASNPNNILDTNNRTC